MSRITAPASKLTRALLESQRPAGAILMPKYDELLRSSRSEESRSITTKHRPTPQPSIANRPRPLMQGFHSSAPSKAPISHVDTTVLPALHTTSVASEPMPRMPLLPDNYGAYHASMSDATDLPTRAGTIVAANPDVVVAGAPLAEIEPVTVDGVELKFAHERPLEERNSIFSEMWRGMVEDILPSPKKAV